MARAAQKEAGAKSSRSRSLPRRALAKSGAFACAWEGAAAKSRDRQTTSSTAAARKWRAGRALGVFELSPPQQSSFSISRSLESDAGWVPRCCEKKALPSGIRLASRSSCTVPQGTEPRLSEPSTVDQRSSSTPNKKARICSVGSKHRKKMRLAVPDFSSRRRSLQRCFAFSGRLSADCLEDCSWVLLCHAVAVFRLISVGLGEPGFTTHNF